MLLLLRSRTFNDLVSLSIAFALNGILDLAQMLTWETILRREWACSTSFCLYSRTFRGVTGTARIRTESARMTLEQDEITNLGVLSTLSIVRTVAADAEIQSYLDGLSIYFGTMMIAFAVVFLLKASPNNFPAKVWPDVKEIQSLLTSLVTVLKLVTSTMRPQHLLVKITHGIYSLLERYYPPAMEHQPEQFESNFPISNLNWITSETFGHFFMSEYDFLMNEDLEFNTDF
ncbi:Fc.00g073640.m01.CDS01 [Cosmosporella sp. VM-42]